jgi:hypothetical protein
LAGEKHAGERNGKKYSIHCILPMPANAQQDFISDASRHNQPIQPNLAAAIDPCASS